MDEALAKTIEKEKAARKKSPKGRKRGKTGTTPTPSDQVSPRKKWGSKSSTKKLKKGGASSSSEGSDDEDATANSGGPTPSNRSTAGSLAMASADYTNQYKMQRKVFKEKNPFEGFLTLSEDGGGLNGVSKEFMDSKNPKEAPKKRKITLKGLHKELYECKLPDLVEAPKEQREMIFRTKMRLAKATCEFKELTKVKLLMIEKKEKILTELSEFCAKHHWFKVDLFVECIDTISHNLFRPLPYQERPPALSFFNDEVFDKDTTFEVPSWRHVKLVYDLTWRVINTPQVTAAMMEKYMTGKFLYSLVELFASEDHRERAYLMMILHKIYGRCLKLRPYIIEILCHYLYRMIYTDDFQHVNGIIELLQIIC